MQKPRSANPAAARFLRVGARSQWQGGGGEFEDWLVGTKGQPGQGKCTPAKELTAYPAPIAELLAANAKR